MITRYAYSESVVVEERVENDVRERRMSVNGAFSRWKKGTIEFHGWTLPARGGAPHHAAKLVEVRQAG